MERKRNGKDAFQEGSLVYVGKTTELEHFLRVGLPQEQNRRLFGDTRESQIRLAMLGRRFSTDCKSDFVARLRHASCLAPQLGLLAENQVGISLDTSGLVKDSLLKIEAVGIGFQEANYRDIYPVLPCKSIRGIPVNFDEEGFLDEVRINLPVENPILDAKYIDGVIVGSLCGTILRLTEKFPKIPFFTSSGSRI